MSHLFHVQLDKMLGRIDFIFQSLCAIFATTLSSDITLSTILQVANGKLHGPVHIMIGGFWNTAQKVMVRYGSKQVGDNFLLMTKWLWRTGLVRTPSYCSSDTASEDCMTSTCAFPGEGPVMLVQRASEGSLISERAIDWFKPRAAACSASKDSAVPT